MTKKIKDPAVKTRIVFVSEDDNKALKRHFLDLENSGRIKSSRQNIVDRLFKIGLYEDIKSLRNEES
jgi:hypothetical protein